MNILYQDDHIIAINKPSGMSTIPNDKTIRELCLVGLAEKETGQKLFVVHRLDKDTSGVVVFAKTAQAHRDLSMQFEHKKVLKKYMAIVAGAVDFTKQEINIPISKSKKNSRKVALSSKGLETITDVRLLKKYEGYSVLDIYPRTGRRHQIRLHLKAIKYPLAIDALYGRPDSITVNGVTLSRMPLHASKITFSHPDTKNEITIEAPLPSDMSEFISALAK